MGFLKKIFKPVSKVLDKIIPNEIKPALPYLAAFAPMFGPTSALMGSGIMNRALISGGLNIAGQLSQEGNEGDINLLSAGLGALSGAMTAPGFKSSLEGFRPTSANEMTQYGMKGSELAPSSFLDKARNVGIDYLGRGSDFMQAPGLTKYGIPAAQGSLDNMYAQAKRDQDAYDDMMSEDSGGGYTDDAYRAAIRKSMEAYGASEEEILKAIEAAGYKTGGRVGFETGGLGALGAAMEKEPETFSMDGSDIQILMPDNNPTIVGEGTQGDEKMLLIEVNGNTMMISEDEFYNKFGESKAKGGRVGLKGGGMDYMETEPGILGNPAVMEKIENMREFKIMNPDIEDITDYSEKYKSQKPDFNNIDETVEIVDNQEIEESQDKIKDSMFVSIAKEIGPMLLGVPGMMYKIGSDAYKMYQNLEQKDKDKVMDISEKIVDVVNYTTPAGLAIKTGEFVKEKIQNKKDGGMMDLGGKEMDLRKGGFVPIGKKERADDVPARLSKNEFVMTADAVRAAGGGSVNKGAKRMYNLMNTLEAKA
jgi:hypothetical protein